MTWRLVRAALLAGSVVAAALAGCATPAVAPEAAVSRPFVAAFELEGRLSASDGTRAGNGALRWVHGAQADEWTLLSPLGQIVGQLVATPQGARMLTADGRLEQGDDAGAMLQRLLGVPTPLDALPSWVQAAPRRGARVLALDATGRPARITDDGWTIDYPDYATPAADAAPRRIDAHWGDNRLRLIIDQWTPLD